MTKSIKTILIVDDDALSNLLSKMAIKLISKESQITDFVIPEAALEFIRSDKTHNADNAEVIVFLDLNMPTMTGWEFLEAFDKFEEKLKKQYKIYILSSSINPADIERAEENIYVKDFIEKPLNKHILHKIFG